METIQAAWSQQICRVEDGLFFGSDEYIALEGSPESGYTGAVRCSASELIAAEPDAWCALLVIATEGHEGRNLSVHVGGTSWEAEGFVAVVDHSTDQLLWLLHLSASESFTEVKIEGDTIGIQSGGYPNCFRWRNPISAPEFVSVIRVDPLAG